MACFIILSTRVVCVPQKEESREESHVAEPTEILHPAKGDLLIENTIQHLHGTWWLSGWNSLFLRPQLSPTKWVRWKSKGHPLFIPTKHKGKTVIMLGIEPCYTLSGNHINSVPCECVRERWIQLHRKVICPPLVHANPPNAKLKDLFPNTSQSNDWLTYSENELTLSSTSIFQQNSLDHFHFTLNILEWLL